MSGWGRWNGFRSGTLAACLLVTTAIARADAAPRVSLFLRDNHIHLRIPDGPEYQAVVNSPVYEAYAQEHATDCARPPIVAARDKVGIYFKSSQGPQTGVVRFEVLVSPTGSVIAFQVLESPGGYALYSVIKAVRDWSFIPGETGSGRPTYCRYQYGFRFTTADT